MARKQDLLRDILLYLSAQGPKIKTGLSELCREIGVSSRGRITEALDQLEASGYVERSGLDRDIVLCWITYPGRQILKEMRKPEIVHGALETEAPTINHDGPVVGVPEQFLESSGPPGELDPQCVYIIQRQDLIELIKDILEDPGGKRIVFLYGQPLVGKTFVLEQLGERLQDDYVPVFIHVNGWASTRRQLAFLNELAESIRIDIESSGTELEIEPFKPNSELQATAEFSRFMHDLSRSIQAEDKPFLLMFDELEYLAREEVDRRIFEYLTGFVDAYVQRARFVFAGSGNMLDLLKRSDLATLLAKGRSVHVDCFDKKTSRDWAVALAAPYFAFEPKALDGIIRLADGHPCLLKEVIAIITRQWRGESRNGVVTTSDLSKIIEDLCIELCPKLTDIWYRLPSSEKLVLHQVVQHDGESFMMHEIVAEDEIDVDNCLKQLVERRILDYDAQGEVYNVRLGLLVESISRGILSVSN